MIVKLTECRIHSIRLDMDLPGLSLKYLQKQADFSSNGPRKIEVELRFPIRYLGSSFRSGSLNFWNVSKINHYLPNIYENVLRLCFNEILKILNLKFKKNTRIIIIVDSQVLCRTNIRDVSHRTSHELAHQISCRVGITVEEGWREKCSGRKRKRKRGRQTTALHCQGMKIICLIIALFNDRAFIGFTITITLIVLLFKSANFNFFELKCQEQRLLFLMKSYIFLIKMLVSKFNVRIF